MLKRLNRGAKCREPYVSLVADAGDLTGVQRRELHKWCRPIMCSTAASKQFLHHAPRVRPTYGTVVKVFRRRLYRPYDEHISNL
jgi:hypothetical protein